MRGMAQARQGVHLGLLRQLAQAPARLQGAGRHQRQVLQGAALHIGPGRARPGVEQSQGAQGQAMFVAHCRAGIQAQRGPAVHQGVCGKARVGAQVFHHPRGVRGHQHWVAQRFVACQLGHIHPHTGHKHLAVGLHQADHGGGHTKGLGRHAHQGVKRRVSGAGWIRQRLNRLQPQGFVVRDGVGQHGALGSA